MDSYQPQILYCCKGRAYVAQAIISMISAKRFGYENFKILVADQSEADFVKSYLPSVEIQIFQADRGSYPAISYKAFVFKKYFVPGNIKGKEIVICDSDVLWHQNPSLLFERFKNQCWFHKITAIDTRTYFFNKKDILETNLPLWTIKSYADIIGEMKSYPNFIVNAGLFKIDDQLLPAVMDSWMKKILLVPAKDMKLSEALLAVTLAEIDIQPLCDPEDVKHLGKEKNKAETEVPIKEFKTYVSSTSKSYYTGYQTAKHYYGDQRQGFINDSFFRIKGIPYELIWEVQKGLWKQRITPKIKKIRRWLKC